MKKLVVISFAISLFVVQIIPAQGVCRSGSSWVRMSVDYSPLDGYGEWIEIEPNRIVWRPIYISELWRPYSVGRWLWTDYGWYWDSYEPFGGVTFHYGRWNYDYRFGWVWYPDYEWGPAWVEWRYGPSYVGWAPLSPYSIINGAAGVVTVNYNDDYYHWNFVSYEHFHGRDLERFLVYGHRASKAYNHSKKRGAVYYRDGRVYNGGIDRSVVERRSGATIRTRDVSNKIYKIRKEERSDITQRKREKRNLNIIQTRHEKSESRHRNVRNESREKRSKERKTRNYR